MKISHVLLAVLVALVLVDARRVANPLDSIMELVSKVAGTAIAVIMTPILIVAQVVEEKIVAPITNKVSGVALDIAVGQFCGLVVGPNLERIGFDTTGIDVKEECLKAAKEEVKKGFSDKYA